VTSQRKKIILVIFGTRPEAIKLAPVIQELRSRDNLFTTRVCVTSQHKEMLEQVLDFFQIKPNCNLNIMQSGQSLYHVTSSALSQLENILDQTQPDWVLVQGDTNTAFTASLAAFYQQISIGHVEAGLRTGKKYFPFPEEMYRKMTDSLADLYFAPTENASLNLQREGVDSEKIHVTGNTGIDALLQTLAANQDPATKQKISDQFRTKLGITIKDRTLILVTLHRRESFGTDLENMCLALKDISRNLPGADIIWPLHPNPKVKEPAAALLENSPSIHLIDPVDYSGFVYLMDQSRLILTDSGGIQEEAPALGKPVLVLRSHTERPEGIEAGTAVLAGTLRASIAEKTLHLMKNESAYQDMAKKASPYGDGRAAQRIVNILEKTGRS
jgi:UDP-N-acetylglucosamine 2-epimerase (non-hydrolysing)